MNKKPSAFERVKLAGFDVLYDRIQTAISYSAKDLDVCCEKYRIALERALKEAFTIAGIKVSGTMMAGQMIELLKKKIPRALLNPTYIGSFNKLNDISKEYHHDADNDVMELRDRVKAVEVCKICMSNICVWLIYFKENCPEYIKLHGSFGDESVTQEPGTTQPVIAPITKEQLPNSVLTLIKKRIEYQEEVQSLITPDYIYDNESDRTWMEKNLPLIKNGSLLISELSEERKDDVFFVLFGEPFRCVHQKMVEYGAFPSGLMNSMDKYLSSVFMNTTVQDADTIFFSVKQFAIQENIIIEDILRRVGVPSGLIKTVSNALNEKSPDYFRLILLEHGQELDYAIHGLSFFSLVYQGTHAIPNLTDEECEVFLEMISDYESVSLHGDNSRLSSLLQKAKELFRIDELKRLWLNYVRDNDDYVSLCVYNKLYFRLFEFAYRYNVFPLGVFERKIFQGFFENPLLGYYQDVLISDDELLEYPEIAERIIDRKI